MDTLGTACSCLFTISLLIGMTTCHEITYGRVYKLPRPHASLSSSGKRDVGPYPFPNANPLPRDLQMDIQMGENRVHLDLEKQSEFDPDVPVYELKTDEEGKDQIVRASLSEPEYWVYRDIARGAGFMVVPGNHEQGAATYAMQGVVHSKGRTFEVKTTGRRRRTVRQRRSNGDDASAHIVDDEEEDEEIELVLLPDMKANDADFDLRPSNAMGETTDPPPPPPHAVPPFVHFPRRRRKRAVTQDIYIDVVAVADYKVYKTWYNRSIQTEDAAKRQDALENIRKYYAFVMNGVDQLYHSITTLNYTIHVRLASLIVASTPEKSTFTEDHRMGDSVVHGFYALYAFQDWAQDMDISYDHLMLFSGYDLAYVDPSSGNLVKALAGINDKTGSICESVQSTSIIEDQGGLQCIATAAHELGHGLSAWHDGNTNPCRSEDNYIMASGDVSVASADELNPWKFSNCSVGYFSKFFEEQVQLPEKRNCLYNTLKVSKQVPDVTSQRAGQVYDPDAQCRQVHGKNAYMFPGKTFGWTAKLCTALNCTYRAFSGSGSYLQWLPSVPAATGTSCGNRKWCVAGQCVADSRAPPADENCMFGDQPGLYFEDKNCSTLVNESPQLCLLESVSNQCCQSCGRHSKRVQNDSCVEYPWRTLNGMPCAEFANKKGDICDYPSVFSYCCQSCRRVLFGAKGE